MDEDDIRAALERIEQRQAEQDEVIRAVAEGLRNVGDRLNGLTTALSNYLEMMRDLLAEDLDDDEPDSDDDA